MSIIVTMEITTINGSILVEENTCCMNDTAASVTVTRCLISREIVRNFEEII